MVISALKAVEKATDPKVPNPATSPDAIAAYADLVNTVAEAAKSSSTAAATLSFSMTRLTPGMLAFLYAVSVSIRDEDTFGSEAVCSTAIYYRFMQSIDDIRNQAAFDLARLDRETLINLKTLQVALVDDLASGKIDLATWNAKDSAYDAVINKVEDRLKSRQFDSGPRTVSLLVSEAPVVAEAQVAVMPEVNKIAMDAAKKLTGMGMEYAVAQAKTEYRIKSAYF